MRSGYDPWLIGEIVEAAVCAVIARRDESRSLS